MKLFLAAAFAVATAAAADIPACQVTQLKLLMDNPNVALCVTKSGVVFSALTSTPTDAQLASMCKTNECVALLAAIIKLDPADCTLPVDGGIALRSQIVDPAIAYCKKSGVQVGSAAGAGSSSSASGGNASVGTVKAADTTSSSVSATANTTNTTTPTPTPSSGAAAHALVAASSVIALATVAATML